MLEPNHFTVLSQNIVKALVYFDLFNYPLKPDEVYCNLQTNHVTPAEVATALQELADAKVLFQSGEYFSLQPNGDLISRRINGNRKAAEYRRIAERRARLIHQFPFVRAVMISGSLSKDYADEQTDVDFFIITAPGRLWVARTLLVVFKRIFLLNSHKFFCVNYFIDEEHLEIEEKNLFTATELSTLMPMQGIELYRRFVDCNAWVREILPNAREKKTNPGDDADSWLKRSLENVLDSRIGTWLEKKFMRLTQLRWRKRYERTLPTDDFEIAFKSKGYVSKNHPDNFQRKVLDRYQQKLDEFAVRHRLRWTHD